MLKIVYPICCGIDVHKTFVVATVATTDRENITTCQTRRFSTFTKDLRALALWLSNNQCMHVCILCLSHMDELKRYIYQVEATAAQLAASYSGALKIIQSVPGISDFSALAIFSEIGADMSSFHSGLFKCALIRVFCYFLLLF